jgi:hypothetical protein
VACEAPLERLGDGLVMALEVQQPVLERRERVEVVRGEHFSLEDGDYVPLKRRTSLIEAREVDRREQLLPGGVLWGAVIAAARGSSRPWPQKTECAR